MLFFVIFGLIIAIAAILFAFQNSAIVAINFGIWEFKESLAIVLLITLGLGIIISLLLSIPTFIKRGWKSSNQNKKITDLEYKLQSRSEEIARQEKTSEILQNNIRELLQAFELSDQGTGLLRKNTVVELLSHLLQQMRQPDNHYRSMCTLLILVEPAKANRNFINQSQDSIDRAIASRLKNAVSPDSFLGISDRNQFICLIPGLMGQEATTYSEYLRNKVTESPLQRTDGTTMPLKISIGGVIADPTDAVDKDSLLQQAEQNLEQAQESRYFLKISEVTTKVV